MRCRECKKCLCDSKYIIKIWPFIIWHEKIYVTFCSIECAKWAMFYGWHYNIQISVSWDIVENTDTISKIFKI